MSKYFLSIIIPVYNEEKYILKCLLNLNKIKKRGYQIIVINDGSKDNTNNILRSNRHLYDDYISYDKNKGKGYAFREGLKKAKGNITIIQDGDLEYNPKDITKIINYMLKNSYDAVYGSRLIHKNKNKFISRKRIFFNILLTKFSNLLNNQSLTDAHTCYKAIKTNLYKKLRLNSRGFELCVEINSKLSKRGIEIYEVPISFNGRGAREGKKIKTSDGLKALYKILRIKISL